MRRIAQLLILLVIALLIIPLFLPSKIIATAEKEFNLPESVVFEAFNNLNEFSKWETLTEADSTAVKEFYAPYRGQGAGYKWSKDKEVKGELTIIQSDPSKSIEFEMNGFNLGEKSIMKADFTPKNANKTNVKWSIESDEIGYFSRYFSYFTSSKLNDKLTLGLEKLGKNLQSITLTQEQAGALPPNKIRVEKFEGQKLITVLNQTTLDEKEIKTATEESFGLLYSYLTDYLKLAPTDLGYPISYFEYYDVGSKKAKFYCGYPIKESVKLGEGMELLSVSESETLVCIHKGAYSTINSTLEKMRDHAAKNAIQLENSYWEEYHNDPEVVKNPEELLTKIYIPIKK